MDEWSGWHDPAELRIKLDIALQEIAELRMENERLRERLGTAPPAAARDEAEPLTDTHPPTHQAAPADSGLPYADATSSPQAKVALFRALFSGRADVYATRWVSSRSGRTGWSPAEDSAADSALSPHLQHRR